MPNLIHMPRRWGKRGLVTFTRAEISQCMSSYGVFVTKGEWRDYALDSLPDRAVFSIFRHTNENPIYSIVKTVAKNSKKTVSYTLFDADKQLKKSNSILDVLSHFTEDQKRK